MRMLSSQSIKSGSWVKRHARQWRPTGVPSQMSRIKRSLLGRGTSVGPADQQRVAPRREARESKEAVRVDGGSVSFPDEDHPRMPAFDAPDAAFQRAGAAWFLM